MRPKLHFTAPYYWINDPNGLIYYKGNYHVFYQHFPYASQWGTMHWGHATTKDFIHFEHLPMALYPSKDYDRNGCFSGSAIEKDGKLYLYYTSIKYAKENPEYVHVQYSDDDLIASQSLMISDNGFDFDNQKNKHLVIDVIKDETLGDVRHTRDPKVWIMNNGHIGMIIGSKIPSQTGYSGEVLLYESIDGLNFTYRNRFVDDTIGDMWECPDLFQIDEQYYMIFSPENIDKPPKPVSNAVIMPVSFDEDTMTITKTGDYMYLDYGLDFYAPQTFLDENHKRTMLGWLRMRESIPQEPWIGMFIMPRVITQKDGHIYQNVIQNIKDYFNTDCQDISLDQPFYMQVEFNDKSQLDFGGMKLYIEDDCLYCDRSKVSIEHDKVCNVNHTPKLNGQYQLDIYYDHHVFEIFINGGYYVLSQVVYNLSDDISMNEVKVIKTKIHQ